MLLQHPVSTVRLFVVEKAPLASLTVLSFEFTVRPSHISCYKPLHIAASPSLVISQISTLTLASTTEEICSLYLLSVLCEHFDIWWLKYPILSRIYIQVDTSELHLLHSPSMIYLFLACYFLLLAVQCRMGVLVCACLEVGLCYN